MHVFIQCDPNGMVPIHMHCSYDPPKTLFDDMLLVCNYDELVDCSDRPIIDGSTTTTLGTTIASTITSMTTTETTTSTTLTTTETTTTTTVTTITTTGTTTTADVAEFECPEDVSDINFIFPDPEDCRGFYEGGPGTLACLLISQRFYYEIQLNIMKMSSSNACFDPV